MLAASTSRFSKVADNQSLQGIFRGEKGECWFDGAAGPPPVPPSNAGPWGPLFLTPSMIATQLAPPAVFQPPFGPQQFGGIIEPHNPRGSRLQMTYHEDVFGLGYHDASTMMIDVEQMYWA